LSIIQYDNNYIRPFTFQLDNHHLFLIIL